MPRKKKAVTRRQRIAVVGEEPQEEVSAPAKSAAEKSKLTRGRRRCPHCDAIIAVAHKTCPECGEVIARKDKSDQPSRAAAAPKGRKAVATSGSVSGAIEAAATLIRHSGGTDEAKEAIAAVNKLVNACGSNAEAEKLIEQLRSLQLQ